MFPEMKLMGHSPHVLCEFSPHDEREEFLQYLAQEGVLT